MPLREPLSPLRFRPLFKRYLWGGRRLETSLGKSLGAGDDYAESWEVADHDQGMSVVADGPLAGTTLRELVRERGGELLGRQAPQPRFPLIFKFLDAQRDLSVQVHPDDAAAARLDPPDLGKTEAWVILDAAPGSRLYAGLRPGIDRPALERAVRAGNAAECLQAWQPRAGDCVFVPAGTVHALGAGLLVAEIQQASDTTYRLFDWNRVGPAGQPRKLHLAEALAAIDYQAGPRAPQTPQPTGEPGRERLVACDKFLLDRWALAAERTLATDHGFQLLAVLEGEVVLTGDFAAVSLARGQTTLIPACVASVALRPQPRATLLVMSMP